METTLWSAARFGLDLLLKVSLLISLVLLLIGGLRRLSASTRHLLAMLGLAGALALPLVSPLVPRVRIPLVPSLLPARKETKPGIAVHSFRTASPKADAFDSGRGERFSPEAADTVRVQATRMDLPSDADPAATPLRLPALGPDQIVAIALGLWALGAAASLARLAFGWARLSRISAAADPVLEPGWTETAEDLAGRLGLSRPVRLLASADVPVAMTAGIRKPVLLLHDGARKWPSERRRVVLLHELAHVRRRDWITLLVAELAAAVYWFHPLVWLARREARRSCERACDDLVLDAGTKPSVYAAHLLGIVRSLKPARAAALPVMAMARPSQFEGRMRAILDPGLHRRGPSPAATRGAALGALFAVVSLGALQPWADRTCAAALAETPSFVSPGSGARPGVSRSSAHPKKPCEGAPKGDRGVTAPASDESIAGFVLASSSKTRSGSEWYSRAMDLHNDERYDEAISAFEKSIELGYKEPASTYNIACGFARKGDARKALDYLEKAKELGFDVDHYLGRDDDLESLRSDPRFIELKRQARAQQAAGHEAESRQASKSYERLEARGTADGSAYFETGRSLLKSGDHALAAKAFRKAAELGHRPGASSYNEACALSLAGQTAPALDALRQAIESGYDGPGHMREDDDLDPIRSDPRYRELETLADDLSMPSIHWKDGFLRSTRRAEWRDAARRAEQAARKYPRLGRAWFNLGFVELKAERPDAALEAFQKALELQYRKPVTTYNIACSYARLDRKDEAFDWLFRALNSGFEADGMIRGDEDLDNLRGDSRFRKALEIARARSSESD